MESEDQARRLLGWNQWEGSVPATRSQAGLLNKDQGAGCTLQGAGTPREPEAMQTEAGEGRRCPTPTVTLGPEMQPGARPPSPYSERTPVKEFLKLQTLSQCPSDPCIFKTPLQ